jgi:agmatinase
VKLGKQKMLSGPFLPRNWTNSTENFDETDCVMVGLPYDETCSYRPGARFAPELIRIASYGLESYSPIQGRDLDEVKFYDAGEIEFQLGNRDDSLQKIQTAATETISYNKKWLGIGGEHLVTYPVIKAYKLKYPELYVIHFDAHADVRENYLDEELSHACAMKRVSEIITPDNLIQIGIRSGTQEEFQWMKENNTLAKTQEELKEKLKFLENKPVFLSIDLDVLDPSLMSGTGTPEPGGMTYNEFMSWLMLLKKLNIVGADVVELSPHYDHSGVSTVTAAKVIREVLLLMN